MFVCVFGSPVRPGRETRTSGFTMIEVLIAAMLLAVAATAAVLHLTRSTQHLGWVQDKIFAEHKALTILNELRAHALGAPGVVAADLRQFDDGVGRNPTLTILRDPLDPQRYVAPDHLISANHRERGVWRWWRQISVAPCGGDEATLDKRLCTVRIYRQVPGEADPGTMMAEVSGLMQTLADPVATHQVFDVYVLALENHPGWWVDADARRSTLTGALLTLELRNPGLEFRVHWITKAGYGRNEQYAPYANEERAATDTTPWTYVYPGALDSGGALPARFYDANQIQARLNLDGATTPVLVNDYAPVEPFVDANGNGTYDEGEVITDLDADGAWSRGNPLPYALADRHNHCMRWPDAVARFDARVAAGTESEEEPTWRLLLDRMAADPVRYRNALVLNLHGEILPLPPARNYSDACRLPDLFPGWRAVTHPERLHAVRVPGDDALSTSPRFRVHAYKASFENGEPLMTQEEPYVDANGNGIYDPGESYQDWNGNAAWDVGIPLTLVIPGGDFTWAPNGASNPSLVVRCLPGGVDADGDGTRDAYADWMQAPRYPEPFTDTNGNDIHEVQEVWLDLNGDGVRAGGEPHQELDGNGTWTAVTESLADQNGNGRLDRAQPTESFTDTNGNGRWDAAEPYWDRDGNGSWTQPTTPAASWKPWDPSDYGNTSATLLYIAAYGEPFLDLDGDGRYDPAEALVDANGNGVWDGGFRRGEMWYDVSFDAVGPRTVISLHGTPLEAPADAASRGLPAARRLYDMEYVPCPTPATAAGPDRFERDLYEAGDFPKNTARWTVELPSAAIRRAFESIPGAADGDAVDRVLSVETRITDDLGTGVSWPVANSPGNRSVSYVYQYAAARDIPFSERHQFLGDPRHSPYADTDRTGTTRSDGYNWYFDDFRTNGDAQAHWLAFDGARLRPGWLGRSDADVPRFMEWLRTALTTSQGIFASMPGFSFRYLSLGGDVGFAPGGPAAGVRVDGTPFGLGSDVEDNTLLAAGTAPFAGSVRYVRANAGADTGLRAGGSWWSKPWLGELAPDAAHAAQWSAWGNLRAAAGVVDYRLVPRDLVNFAQQPTGTRLRRARGELGDEGCTAFFNIGAGSATFHHRGGPANGLIVADGVEVADAYGFDLPAVLSISHPFGLDWSADGSTGPEFAFPADFPRHSATLAARFVASDPTASAGQGSAMVRLTTPGGGSACRVVVNGMDPAALSGAPFSGRFTLITMVHGFFVEGQPGTPQRIVQLPRVRISEPAGTQPLNDPVSVPIRWNALWRRWDNEPYAPSYAATFSESDSDLAYHLLYSADGGSTWFNMLGGAATQPGVLPRVGGAPDPARTLRDLVPGGDEAWTWSTPGASFPAGQYVVRLEAHRTSDVLHYAYQEMRWNVTR